MKLSKERVQELGQVLKEEFNLELDDSNLEKLAYSLAGYFDLLLKIENRHKFGNRSRVVLDSDKHKDLDNDEERL